MRHLLFLTAVLLLGGCTSTTMDTAHKFLGRTPLGEYMAQSVNLTENNYAAADYLAHQLQKQYIHKNDTIKIMPLVNTQSPELPAQFDFAVAGAIGTRLEQLGYSVDFSAVDPVKQAKPSSALLRFTGRYRQDRDYYHVSLQITRLKDAEQMAAFDYKILRTWEIDKLAAPEARIMKVKQP